MDVLIAQLSLALAPALAKRKAQQQSSLQQAAIGLLPPRQKLIEATERWLAREHSHIIDWFSPHYPPPLREVHQPPAVLFCEGDLELLSAPQVAIVGSRKATPAGLHSASFFASRLATLGVVVSSGLALGIDAAAHKAAMTRGRTLAVLGTGMDCYYPTRHRQLQQEIAAAGLLVSEWPPTFGARSDHFPRRNRILVGLAKAVLVVEAVARSGSLITANYALEQGVDLFAVPNSMWEPAAAGSNKLLQEGALMALSELDIVGHWLGLQPASATASMMAENKSHEGLANEALLANVGFEATTIDTIVARSGLDVATVTEQLTMLELAGHVVSTPGGYIRMGRR